MMNNEQVVQADASSTNIEDKRAAPAAAAAAAATAADTDTDTDSQPNPPSSKPSGQQNGLIGDIGRGVEGHQNPLLQNGNRAQIAAPQQKANAQINIQTGTTQPRHQQVNPVAVPINNQTNQIPAQVTSAMSGNKRSASSAFNQQPQTQQVVITPISIQSQQGQVQGQSNAIVPLHPQQIVQPQAQPLVQTPLNTISGSSEVRVQQEGIVHGITNNTMSASINAATNVKVNSAGLALAPLNRDGKNLSEKKIRRLEKNRLSARNCRRKKKEYTQNLQREMNILEGENLRLRLQLQIGQEAEQSSLEEQERVTEGIDELLKSGASDSEIHSSIEEFKEKFADYGRDRRSAMEFHLRNVERLLMPTTTTSLAMRALEGGGKFVSGGGGNVNVMNAARRNGNAAAAQSVPRPVLSSATQQQPRDPSQTEHTSKFQVQNKEPKELFKYLVGFLQVSPKQAAALKDSRHVARDLDDALAKSLSMLEELRGRLTNVGQDLDAEFSEIRSILTPRQAAKFLVWVANNGACMHMLNELWSKVYPEPVVDNTEEEEEEEGEDTITE